MINNFNQRLEPKVFTPSPGTRVKTVKKKVNQKNTGINLQTVLAGKININKAAKKPNKIATNCFFTKNSATPLFSSAKTELAE